ncbi:MAG TPA: HAD family hydrolase [Synergistaceae bacterium]|nr:HAD family hydrolase [Synergistaceae bacterium]HQF91569.1 HAD family hydrolase [Synergistaceae bacterium]HQH77709.1 HAD family hydrolase [Synergistaceae bacterium]HQK24113.1 HAD family hydrolase [Synergistaceae bacterium]
MDGIDGLIFDIDGVLLDISDSYFPMMREVLRRLAEGVSAPLRSGEEFSRDHLRVAKKHPAFNDDYDIPWVFFSFREHALRRGDPADVRAWEEALSLCPPDPSEALVWVQNQWAGRLSRDWVRILCDRLYFGDAYRRVRPESDCTGLGPGFWSEERALIHRPWRSLPLPSAIYTGRSRGELDLVFEKLGWEDFPRGNTVTADDGILKPSPEGLILMAQRLGASFPLYFGDTESDLLAHRSFGRGVFVAVGSVLTEWRPRYPSAEEALRDLFP